MKVLRKAFKQQLEEALSEFVSSVKDDQSLIDVDIAGSLAHVQMLRASKLITDAQADNLSAGLKQIKELAADNQFNLEVTYEDVHMNVEKKLEEIIGADAKLLHTARSRNDQVALDMRLFILAQIESVGGLLGALRAALVEKAAANADVVLPGYTHLQRAQPISFAHALLAYAEMFKRDQARFTDAAKRAAVSPLGAGALVGSGLGIQPAITAQHLKELGIEGTFANSIDAVSDRDFIAEFLFAASLTAVHLSQLAETFIIWCTKEFGFIAFPDNLTTASSLMPQKKNPDPVEIVRGKAGLATGELVSILMTLKALPLGYNRDLQETKPGAIRVARELANSLHVMKAAVAGLEVLADNMLRAASDPELMCTDLVEYLVNRGVAFRSAHDAVSALVQHSRDTKVALPNLPLEDYKQFSPAFDADVLNQFDARQSVNAKRSPGSTGPASVAAALKKS